MDGEKWCSIGLTKKPYNVFIIFKNVFKMLTGWNLGTGYLLSVEEYLSKEETHAILALSENIPCWKYY